MADKKFIDTKMTRILCKGIIEHSSSSWQAQVLVTVSEHHKKQLVIDYLQTINKHTLLDAYPLPQIQGLVEMVANYRVFITLDLKSAYHQVPLLPDKHDKNGIRG